LEILLDLIDNLDRKGVFPVSCLYRTFFVLKLMVFYESTSESRRPAYSSIDIFEIEQGFVVGVISLKK
jgi:hypothetical protein